VKLTLKAWHRETFAVQILPRPGDHQPRSTALAEVFVSGPFGVCAGNAYHVGHETPGRKVYSLIHMPSQIVQFTLPRAGLCRQAAAELADCDLAWESAWGPGVVGAEPEMAKAREIHLRWQNWGKR
jgi:hypothetical protein